MLPDSIRHTIERALEAYAGDDAQAALDWLRLEPLECLSPREMDVVRLAARGWSNHEIAGELCIAERTVRTHVSNVLGKLGLPNRTKLALWAIRHQVIVVEPLEADKALLATEQELYG
jgi:DNA-binding NarL/FixJ family response regulator